MERSPHGLKHDEKKPYLDSILGRGYIDDERYTAFVNEYDEIKVFAYLFGKDSDIFKSAIEVELFPKLLLTRSIDAIGLRTELIRTTGTDININKPLNPSSQNLTSSDKNDFFKLL
jgi:hypothetical protein